MNNEEIKRRMEDAGVGWLQIQDTGRIFIKAKGEDSSGAVLLAEVPDDVICDRARKLMNPAPVPMLLWCPECGHRHVDRGDFATKPHHTHACQECGHVWRPAIAHTVGVQFLPGFRDADLPHNAGGERPAEGRSEPKAVLD